MNASAPRSKTSRNVAVFAGLWVLAVSVNSRMNINGTLLLASVFGILTLASVGYLLVTEMKADKPNNLTYLAVLHLAAWLFVLLALALIQVWVPAVISIFGLTRFR